MKSKPTVRIASQLEPYFNAALQACTGCQVLAVPRGVPTALPVDVQVLIAAPLAVSAGACQDLLLSPPPGWPWGIQWMQLVTSGSDLYPAWWLQTVPVSTARGVAAGPIAEYVLAAVLDHTKALTQRWVNESEQWQPRPLGMVYGTTMGILGYGAIAQAIEPLAHALGIQVKVLRQSKPPLHPRSGTQFVASIEELLQTCDHLVLAAPATPDTRYIINARSLQVARSGLHLINVARGELVDNDALLEALRSGQLARATLDTTYPEPLPSGHPLYTHPRVRITPHSAATGPHARYALIEKIAINLERWQRGEALLDTVGSDT